MLLLLLLLLLLTIFLIVARKPRRSPRCPPGPRGLPFIGNLHQLDISKPHEWLAKLSNKYGLIMLLKLCRVPVLILSSPHVAKIAMIDDAASFLGRPYSSAWSRLSYSQRDIIGSPHNDYWRHMRKMSVLHLLSPQKTRFFRQDEVSKMLAEVSKTSGQIMDVELMAMSFSCNLLCREAFGKKFEESSSSSWRLFDKILKQFLASVTQTFLFDNLVFGWISKACGAAGRVEKVFEKMDSFYQQLIDEHRSRRSSSSDQAMDGHILDLLTRFMEDESAPIKIDWNHIKALLMNVFLAGTDSTGITITWALTALIKNPSAMKKVQDEIRSVVRMKSFVDEDDIEKLPYFKAVIKETLRLYPPIPLVPKETTGASNIYGYEIEPRTLVFVNIWAIGRDPEYWEGPEEFLPERFLNTTIDYKGKDFGFIPFGSGRRMCPGIHLAIATVELALANLLYKFNWELPHGMVEEDVDTQPSIGIIMRKKNPLCLIAKTFI